MSALREVPGSMDFGFYSFLGAFVMLAAGLAALALFDRAFYPLLRERYGQARMRGRKALSPRFVMALVQTGALIILPAAGFVFGGRLIEGLFGQ